MVRTHFGFLSGDSALPEFAESAIPSFFNSVTREGISKLGSVCIPCRVVIELIGDIECYPQDAGELN